MKVNNIILSSKEEQSDNEDKKENNFCFNSWTFSKEMVFYNDINIGEIYCISCFINGVLNNGISLKSKNTQILSITDLYQEKLFFEKSEYNAIIHKITLYKKLAQLELQLLSNDKKKIWNLNKIELNFDKEKIIYDDLEINSQDLPNFLNYYDSILVNNDNNFCIIDKISRNLKPTEKLNIYLNYFRNRENIDNDLKINLVKQFFSSLKNNNKADYSLIIEIFNLCF